MNSLHDPAKSLWNEKDGLFYDHLLSREHEPIPVRARTMVGFVPMFGTTVVPADTFIASRLSSASAIGSSRIARSWSGASGRWSFPGPTIP
jgi:hypothetical protein